MISWPIKATKCDFPLTFFCDMFPKYLITLLTIKLILIDYIKCHFLREKKSPAVPTWLFLCSSQLTPVNHTGNHYLEIEESWNSGEPSRSGWPPEMITRLHWKFIQLRSNVWWPSKQDPLLSRSIETPLSKGPYLWLRGHPSRRLLSVFLDCRWRRRDVPPANTQETDQPLWWVQYQRGTPEPR